MFWVRKYWVIKCFAIPKFGGFRYIILGVNDPPVDNYYKHIYSECKGEKDLHNNWNEDGGKGELDAIDINSEE